MGVLRPQPAAPATAGGGPIDVADAIAELRASIVAAGEPAGCVDAEAAARLRGILLAPGGREDGPVGRAAADALFDLHDAVAGDANDAAFDELFFRAVVHHLLALAGHPVPPRQVFLSGEAPVPLSDSGGSPVRLGADEAAWLASRIMRDGRPTEAEFALLRFFSSEGRGDPVPCRFLGRAA